MHHILLIAILTVMMTKIDVQLIEIRRMAVSDRLGSVIF